MNRFLSIMLLGSLISLAASMGFSQQPTASSAKLAASQETQTFPLWENGAPGALGHEDIDIPTLTYYPAAHAVPTAVIVAPGGGYRHLAMNHEGRQVANWLNAMGISAFVLKYRLGPRYHHPIELGDAQRAIRLVRTHAAEYGVKPDRIGMMGFSAGGHLTSTAETHFDSGDPNAPDPIDRASSRPDFAILGYAVISFTAPYSHHGSGQALLGDSPDPKLLEDLSNDLQSPPRHLRRFYSAPVRTPRFRRRTAWHSIWPCTRRRCPRSCTSSNMAPTAWDWIWAIPPWANGPSCSAIGFVAWDCWRNEKRGGGPCCVG